MNKEFHPQKFKNPVTKAGGIPLGKSLGKRSPRESSGDERFTREGSETNEKKDRSSTNKFLHKEKSK